MDLSCNGIDVDNDSSLVANHCTSQNQGADVVTEIPDESCRFTKLSKSDLQVQELDYTDQAFRPTCVAVSSIENSLYSAMENSPSNFCELDEKLFCNVQCTAGQNANYENPLGVSGLSLDSSSESLRIRRSSGISDEVFFHCDPCSKLNDDDDSKSSICSTCHRMNFTLSPSDIHVSERTDSAICSTASYESDHTGSIQSESSSATSDEYLMPDSPLAATMATGEAVIDDELKTNQNQTFNFNDVQTSDQITKTKSLFVHNPCYMSVLQAYSEETGRMIRNKLYNGSIIRYHVHDKWCIAETKL